jgi:hypothetical protein
VSALCTWCRKSTRAPLAVGIVERGTGPSGTAYACPPCRDRRRIIPMDAWTDDVGDGRPQSRRRNADRPPPLAADTASPVGGGESPARCAPGRGSPTPGGRLATSAGAVSG